MGQEVRNDSRVCRTPPGPPRDLNLYLRPNPILVAVSLTFILMASGLVYYWILPPPNMPFEDPPPIIRAVIAIDGDANFSATAELEGWPGDGSPENPYIIDGLDIKVNDTGSIDGESHCIFIRNTQVSFIIRNCSITGASCHLMSTAFAGITLVNVSGGLLVNNILHDNEAGIYLANSLSNTVVNNICDGNLEGIVLEDSHLNNVVNNTCNSNGWVGIWLSHSDSNTVANNTCSSNDIGIYLWASNSNIVANNTCKDNRIGISLYECTNTLVNNTTDK